MRVRIRIPRGWRRPRLGATGLTLLAGLGLAGLGLIGACDRNEPVSDPSPVPGQTQPAGDSTDLGPADSTTTAAPTTTVFEPVAIEIWADDIRANVLEPVAAEFTEATGIDVTITRIEFAELRSELQEHGPDGGPDVFFGAGDWAGRLAEAGLAAPVDLGSRTGEFTPVSLAAFSYQGALYGLPQAAETIAVYYNTDLVDGVPATMDELVDVCQGLESIQNCFGVPGGGDDPDLLHQFPFLTAEGGGVFAYDPALGYDPTTVIIDSRQSLDGVEVLETLVGGGVIGPTGYDRAKELFLAGSQPFWMTGPWELGPLDDADVAWAVGRIPAIGRGHGRPLVGASGWYINAASDSPVIAQTFVLDYLATSETMLAMFEADRRPPAHVPTLEIIADPIQAVFVAEAADGLPWPTVPEMEFVWRPLGEALRRVRTGEAAAREALTEAQLAVETALTG